MKLKVLGSSSSGNGYMLISSSNEVLLLEAGVHFKEVQKALKFDISGICGCIISHSHGDHSKHIETYSKNTTCYAPDGVFKSSLAVGLLPEKRVKIGGYSVLPFEVQHDVKTYGYLIKHEESGLILFATDTYYLKHTFPGLNHVLIEANYCENIMDENLKSGKINNIVFNRVFSSHMSIKTTIKTLMANDLSSVINIVLIHLSSGNSDAKRFVKEVKSASGVPLVFAAERGLELNLNKNPF